MKTVPGYALWSAATEQRGVAALAWRPFWVWEKAKCPAKAVTALRCVTAVQNLAGFQTHRFMESAKPLLSVNRDHEPGRDALPRVQADRQVGPTKFMGSLPANFGPHWDDEPFNEPLTPSLSPRRTRGEGRGEGMFVGRIPEIILSPIRILAL